ncbi:MAG: AAA family ATPase [Prevotella sp.]
MRDAYFRGKKELFEGLALEQREKEWTEYPVLHFSLAMAKLGTVENLNNQINMQLGIAEKAYGVENAGGDITTRFYTLVTNLYAKTGKQVVVLIDEYDAPLLNVLHDPERLEPMRNALLSFYSPLKDLDPYLRFVFITGISKFSQLSIFSQINNLYKISMMPEYADICGMTQQELEENFKEGIQKLSEKNNWTTDQVISKLKRRYDGYHFAKRGAGVYNPFSLLYAMDTGELDNYWFSTGTPSFLVKMLKKFHTDVSKIDGSQADASEFDAPTENMHSILPLFYQSGYITIKDHDPILDFYTLGFPNQEVKVGMIHSLIPFYLSTDTNLARSTIAKMYMALRHDDIGEALSVARSFFAGIPYEEGTLKDAPTTEGHFTAMLYLMFSFLNIYIYAQVRTAKGRMDILLKTDTTIYVMELEMDGSTDEALRQIDDKGYTIPYEHDGRRIVKVGINFSSEERTITDWKIKE